MRQFQEIYKKYRKININMTIKLLLRVALICARQLVDSAHDSKDKNVNDVFYKAEDSHVVDGMLGVKEKKVNEISYKPETYNGHIDLINVLVKPDKLILRSSVDEASMIRWDIPNQSDNWSFVIDFNEPNLRSSEMAKLYIFYTKEKPILGGFKGANPIFNGFAAGIEFQGKNVELGYAINTGIDLFNMDEYVTRMDSLNPRRFKDLNNIKLKLISTNKNLKFEIYNGEKIIYDNFRFFSREDLENGKKGHYIGIFADYKNVSSGKAFELKGAQFYTREETKDYIITKSYMNDGIESIAHKTDILHPNEDIQTLIYKIHNLTKFAKSILGELPESNVKNSEIELLKELEMFNNKLVKLEGTYSEKKNNKKHPGVYSNDIDNKIKRLLKNTTDLEFSIESIHEANSKKYNILEMFSIAFGVLTMSLLVYRDVSEYIESRKTAAKV